MSTAFASPLGFGLQFEEVDVWAPLRYTGATSTADVGHVVAFCIEDVAEITSDGATSNATADGLPGSLTASVTRSYTSTATPEAIFAGVVMEVGVPTTTAEPGESTNLYRIRVAGVCNAFVQHPANTAVVRGAPLILSNGVTAGETAGYLQARGGAATSTLTARYIAIFLDTSLSGTTSDGALSKVLFNGLNGFGSANDLA